MRFLINKKTLIIRKNIFILLLVVILIITAVIIDSSAIPAQVADTVLRPALGSKITITLESYYFNIQDYWEKLTYKLSPQPTDPIKITSQRVKETTNRVNSDQFVLTPILPNSFMPPIDGEGQWEVIPQVLFPNQPVTAQTFIRPDITRPYAVVSLVQMDMKQLGIGAEAGTYYPGGERKLYGKGIVPLSIQKANSLIAVFNGGFQEKDGHYGMVVGDITYVPLKKDLATFVMKLDGSFTLTNYADQKFDASVASVRQNGPFLIQNGKITSFVEEGTDTWGRTTTNSIYTWRSGIGITKEGNLIYAAGNALIPQTLAVTLQKAGAINAIQLDINPFWVRFVLYQSLGNGKYSYSSLTDQMQNGGYQYLHGYNKDFFYIYKK